jgi:hypothetical protein
MKRLISKVLVTLTIGGLTAFSAPTFAQAKGKPVAPNYSAVPPAGHEAFFKDLATLMGKYPESAKRFAISDTQLHPPKLSKPQERTSQCPEGQACGFYCWTSPATFECCECNMRPR